MNEELLVYKVKVCLLGNEGVGKSSLIRRFVLDNFSNDYIPTLGTKITKKELMLKKDGKVYNIVLMVYDINGHWDTLGQTIEDFKSNVPENYYTNSEGLIFVCDLTRKETFLSYHFWYDNLTMALGHDIPCIFLGNKADLKDDIKVEEDEIQGLMDEKNARFLYTSAKTGENVEEAFRALAEIMLEGLTKRDDP